MEPFVPEPEERISRKESASGKGKGNGHSYTEHSGGRVGGIKGQVPLLAVALGLGALMWVSHGAKNAEIEALAAQVESLKAEVQQASEPATGDDAGGEEGAAPPGGDYADRLGSLEKLVAEQVSDLETMRNMVAETLSKLDSDLEGSLMGYYETNSKAIAQLKGEMAVIAKLQAGVQEVQSSVKSLSATVDKTGSAQQDQQLRLAKIETQVTSQDKNLASATQADKQVIDRLAKVETQLVAQDKTIAGASQTDKQALDRLAKVENQLVAQDKTIASATQSTKQAQDKLATVETRLSSQQEKLTSVVQTGKQSSDKLATLDQNLKGLESKVADNQKQLAELKSGAGSNTQAIAAVKQTQDKNTSLLSSIQGSVDSLKSLTDGQGKTVAKLDSEGKSLNQSLATIKKDLAALNGELESKVSRSDLDRDLKKASSSGNSLQLQKKIDELSDSLSTIRQELAARDKQFDQLRTQVAQGPKVQAKPAATAAVATSGTVDGAQLASIQRLESSQKQLSQDLSKTQTQLASLSKELKADMAKVAATKNTAAPAASGDLTALNKQLTSITVQLAQTDSKLKTQKSEFDIWKRDVDQSLAGTNLRLNALTDQTASQGGQAVEAKVENILATIKVLKKQHPYAEFPE